MSATALKKGLSDRQLRMIAIGGVIGAGLFVGSGVVISSTGPGAFITYALWMTGRAAIVRLIDSFGDPFH